MSTEEDNEKKPYRLNINVSSVAEGTIKELKDRYGLSTTQAVQRALATAKFVEDAINDGYVVVLRNRKTGEEEQVRLLLL